ncbi:MAG: gamma-glutamyltransferase, partial [Dehalococcoidia bacterium]
MTAEWQQQPPGRQPLQATNGAAATSHPAATSAALEILQAGGTAVDAALAASAVLCVVNPDATGVGGDGFAQVVEPDGTVTAYNAGGTAGSGATPDRYPHGVPRESLRAACIPGLPDCWAAIHERHGAMPLTRLFARAIDLAANG